MQPLDVAGWHPAQPPPHRRGRGRLNRAAIARNPAPRPLAISAWPMTSVLSARRTISSAGSTMWVARQSARRTRLGVTVTVVAPTPRTVRVRPWPNGRTAPRHRGHGNSPARRDSPTRSGPATTITYDCSVHATKHGLPRVGQGGGQFVCLTDGPGRAPSRDCRRRPLAIRPRLVGTTRFLSSVTVTTIAPAESQHLNRRRRHYPECSSSGETLNSG
jgi:hypothetical protein